MRFFQRFERKFGRYAIRGLPRVIALFYGLGMVIQFINPMIYFLILGLDGGAVAHGQV